MVMRGFKTLKKKKAVKRGLGLGLGLGYGVPDVKVGEKGDDEIR